MPIYEYTCKKCGSDFEILVRGEEKPKCPSCNSGSLEKRMSVPATPATSSSDPCGECPGAAMGHPPCGMGGCGMG